MFSWIRLSLALAAIREVGGKNTKTLLLAAGRANRASLASAFQTSPPGSGLASPMRAMLALDRNQDGHIDPIDVESYARSNGMDAFAAAQEFPKVDFNGDGSLDSSEIAKLLDGSKLDMTGRPVSVVQSTMKQHVPEQDRSTLTVKELFTGAIDDADKVLVLDEASQNKSQLVADTIVNDMTLNEREDEQARKLRTKADENQAVLQAIAESAGVDALNAGFLAAQDKTNALVATVEKLQDQAERAQVKAAALNAKADVEAEEANQLLAIAQKVSR